MSPSFLAAGSLRLSLSPETGQLTRAVSHLCPQGTHIQGLVNTEYDSQDWGHLCRTPYPSLRAPRGQAVVLASFSRCPVPFFPLGCGSQSMKKGKEEEEERKEEKGIKNRISCMPSARSAQSPACTRSVMCVGDSRCHLIGPPQGFNELYA